MPRLTAPSFVTLTHEVVQDATEPLTIAEIVAAVQARRPITTAKPVATIRNVVSQSRMIVAVGDHRYGWKPRCISGATLRFTLTAADLVGPTLELGEEHREALFPGFFSPTEQYRDRDPIALQLPDGTTHAMDLTFLGARRWGISGPAAIWQWLRQTRLRPGDQLILTVVDGMARQYAIAPAPRAARHEPLIAWRNQQVITTACRALRARVRYGTMIWELCEHLMVCGIYHDPCPPDPLKEIWTRAIWEPLLDELGLGQAWLLSADPSDDR